MRINLLGVRCRRSVMIQTSFSYSPHSTVA